MPKMMISYRRADTDVIAGRIHDWLGRQYGADSVYFDVESIPFGVDFRTHIRQAVTDSELMIVVIGQQWLGGNENGRSRIHETNDFVRFEVETALECNIPIIPVLVGTAHMPTPDELPESLRRFSFLNAAPM